MKSRTLLAAVAATLLPLSALALTATVNGIKWTYTVTDGKASVGGGSSSSTAVPTSTSGAITIPSKLGNYPVTSIGTYAFYGCSRLTSVSIPDGVTSIGNGAFYNCSGLTSITIPDSVTSIGNRVFYGCRGLTSVTIPDSVTSIGYYAFDYCSGLTSFTVGVNNPNYSSANGLLLSKDGKTLIRGVNGDVIIPDTVTSIGDHAFYNCSGLTSVTIPDSVTSIGYDAFYGCSGLMSVNISDLAAWCGISFSGYVTEGVPEDRSNPLTYTQHLFLDGNEVTDLVIPDAVTYIVEGAFYGCRCLASVTIPDSVTGIGSFAFSGSSGLTSFTVDVNNPNYSSANGLLLSKAGKTLICGVNGDVVIPDTVTYIGGCAFCNCSGLTSVTIPESVTSIDYYAFYGCSGLTSVTIPASVTSIEMYAFWGCNQLVSAFVPNETSIEYDVFPDETNVIRYSTDPIVVSLDAVGGTVSPSSVSRNFGEPYGDLPTPARTGYEFGNWTLHGDAVDAETILHQPTNHALRATWTPNEYTVSFDGNGGSGSMAPVTFEYDERKNLPRNAFSHGGDHFHGWALEPAGDIVFADGAAVSNLTQTANGTVVLYARWVAGNMVSFDSNGGEGMMLPVLLDEGASQTLPKCAFYKEGHFFVGWATSPDGYAILLDGDTTDDLVASGTGHVTLYAVWHEMSQKPTPTVSTGGTAGWFVQSSDTHDGIAAARSGAVSHNQSTWLETVVEGSGTFSFWWKVSCEGLGYDELTVYIDGKSKVSISGNYSWTQESFAISGEGEHIIRWTYSKNESKSSGSDCGWVGEITWPTSNDVFHWASASEPPQLERENMVCVVRFDAAGGAVDPSSKVVVFEDAYGALPTPQHDAYVFLVWRLGGAAVSAATIVETADNHTLSAEWGIAIGNGVWKETICDEPIALGAPLVAPSGAVAIPAEIDGRPVVDITAAAFAGNTAVTSVSIPGSVTNVADGAFAGCTGLKTVALPRLYADRLADLFPDAVDSIEKVVFLDGVTAIPDNFFEGCTALRTMDLAESVVDIGTNVFEACSALTTTVLENGLEMYQGWVLGFAGGSLGELAPPDLAIPAEARPTMARPTRCAASRRTRSRANGALGRWRCRKRCGSSVRGRSRTARRWKASRCRRASRRSTARRSGTAPTRRGSRFPGRCARSATARSRTRRC